ncbi:similar to Saccharomyces cerevisiae YJR053W BFA1 Component of the GTPase-activating Bfa1p-Bub2p complex involved in multiple cell cycle checkpoint pathways that control exit from mitosis [Maudiozyma saulgeensis]|uniref:Similar to Saccharomyces cerevisiae YJR053W BFA1 Component of the GTPase-activating Bfa1p-Bub2p complex involved in multiple cell cycle checkpoint pathways that control exit from mitosis n=1 Tax=Maudiozyma saulgeensis TaxID=1789683 RepID=A0A1X7R1K1_9SACH|nr:similar to Saccharomyces cerevisiae YJR053W BFA1 Component of the GTPase-activating Bfa1p-Bub2p complex involved in multiple cell cycle checkpoint pathways that control exit from mitosis [Kazachstania saulgeensis]
MDITDTSFEEIEPSFLRENNRTDPFSQDNLPKKNNINKIRPEVLQSRPHTLHGLLAAPLSTASSGKTAFSDDIKTQPSWLDDTESRDSNQDFDQAESDDEFLDDFEEFQNKKTNFDEAIKTRFGTYRKHTPDNLHHLSEEFNNYLHFGSTNRPQESRRVGNALRQPKSMMDLKPRIGFQYDGMNGNPRSSRLKNSMSYGNLRSSSRNPTSVRFKKSMPNMAAKIIEEDQESDRENNDSVLKRNNPSDYYLSKFGEDRNNSDDQDFIFESSMIQPSFVPKHIGGNLPIKLSPSIYNIEQHNNLLTPQLHKRTSKNRSTYDQLENFRENSTSNSSRIPSGNLNLNQRAATYRMRTIKQQIDHNTPVKKGNMYYNPQSMKWEGNEHILKKFDEIDSSSTNPLLIKKNKADLEKIENTKIRSKSSRPPEVVGDMMFDEKNLRWVSIHEEPPDPFAGIDDIVQEQDKDTPKSPFLRSKSQTKSEMLSRSLSVNPNLRKYHSFGGIGDKYKTNSNYVSDSYNNTSDKLASTFTISSKLLEHCYHEENRWNKRVGGWFLLNNKYNTCGNEGDDHLNNTSVASLDTNDYMYEIRKMVLSSTNN